MTTERNGFVSDKNFADWEANAFGFGYGTGEALTITALHDFLKAIPKEGCYNYQDIQAAVGLVPCWLLINLLCHQDMIEYGTSPRCGWLTEKGRRLRAYMLSVGADKAYEVATHHDEHCYPTHCNCELVVSCHNPLWKDKTAATEDK